MGLEKSYYRVPMPGELAVVVGAGKSGQAVSRLLAQKGAKVRLLEKNPGNISPETRKNLENAHVEICVGEHSPEQFENASFVIPSPAVPVNSVRSFIREQRPEIISEMEMAWRFLDKEPIIAVTGTSGKTTCASLAASMLKAQGYGVFLGGNIGTPLSEYVLDGRKADALVLEASSFQLQGCATFAPRVAILLNLSANHLDYHKDMQEYAEAKFRIFRCQDENDLAILGQDMEGSLENFKIKSRKLFVKDNGRFPNMKLFGKHNAINAEAAWQAVKFFGVSENNAAKAVNNFLPLSHRLENVAEINGILFVNDSKATTVSALQAAVASFERPVRLLCGGKFKGGDLSAVIPLLREKAAEVCLFGGGREIFERAWANITPVSWSRTLQEATQKAFSSANPGDVVLLSPATSSFDQYRNYQERGNDFKKIVESLK